MSDGADGEGPKTKRERRPSVLSTSADFLQGKARVRRTSMFSEASKVAPVDMMGGEVDGKPLDPTQLMKLRRQSFKDQEQSDAAQDLANKDTPPDSQNGGPSQSPEPRLDMTSQAIFDWLQTESTKVEYLFEGLNQRFDTLFGKMEQLGSSQRPSTEVVLPKGLRASLDVVSPQLMRRQQRSMTTTLSGSAGRGSGSESPKLVNRRSLGSSGFTDPRVRTEPNLDPIWPPSGRQEKRCSSYTGGATVLGSNKGDFAKRFPRPQLGARRPSGLERSDSKKNTKDSGLKSPPEAKSPPEVTSPPSPPGSQRAASPPSPRLQSPDTERNEYPKEHFPSEGSGLNADMVGNLVCDTKLAASSSGGRSPLDGSPKTARSVKSRTDSKDSEESGQYSQSSEWTFQDDRSIPSTGSPNAATIPVVQGNRRSSKADLTIDLDIFTMASTSLAKLNVSNHRTRRKRVFEFLEYPVPGTASMWNVRLASFIIIASIVFTILRSMDPVPTLLQGHGPTIVEFLLDAMFTLEVLLRFVTCPNRRLFFHQLYNILDIVAGVYPLLVRATAELSLTADEDGTCEFLLSFVPVVRVLKLLRHFEQMHLMIRAFEVAFEALPVLLYAQAVIILFFGSLIYIVEPRDNIQTLAKSFWYVIVTMATVGYGDVVPITSGGKTIASALIVCGALYMAMPIGIVGTSFSEVWAMRDRLLVMKRTRDRLLQNGYEALDIPGLFAIFDSTKVGALSLQDFSSMIQHMNIVLDAERVRRLFVLIDGDNSGMIDDFEFVRFLFPENFEEMYCKEEILERQGSRYF